VNASNLVDVAIVGMSGLFPKAPNVEAFWSNILNKVDATGEAQPGWLADDTFFAPDSADVTRIYTKRGGFLGELCKFDPRPFGTMPVSLSGGEPDQFLALKAATDALADAGYVDGSFDSSRAGIILGHAIHAHRANVNGIQHGIVIDQTLGLFQSLFPDVAPERLEQIRAMLKAKLPAVSVDAAPGLVPNMMTGRIANRLNLMGPNYIMDAACASSLLAIDAAIAELRAGRADLMLAGGVNTTTSPLVFMVFCQLGALSRSSRVRPFGHGADGTLLGEGQGMVVLKRLEDALRDGDRIYAVIKGMGRSSDGRGSGLMAPRLEGEILAIERAYQQTGIDPGTIELLEAHGTGIPLGDRTEIQALRRVMGDRQRAYPSVALGSVKSMIGHCIPAAAAASVIKMAMALHTKILPPTLCEAVNPELELERTPFYLNTEAAPWIHSGPNPRRAAINAFGFGGINSHMILEEAPGSSGTVDPGAAFGFRPSESAHLVVLSAETRPALISDIREMRGQLAAAPSLGLAAIAAESVRRLRDGAQRMAVVATSGADLAKKLDQALEKLEDPAVHRVQARSGLFFSDQPIAGKVAFLFPGENSQYVGMLKDLAVAFPMVREWFDFLDDMFAGERDVPHRLLVFPPDNSLTDQQRQELMDRLWKVDAGSESVFCADQALFALLKSFKINPDFLVGHSTGENAAIVASGLSGFTRPELRTFIRNMNEIYARLEREGSVPHGVLLNVGAVPRPALLEALEKHGDIHFTMDNCPNQAILFGSEESIKHIERELTGLGGVCVRLPLAWAYHTPHIAPLAEAFRELFHERTLQPTVPVLYSCASAGPFPSEYGPVVQLAVDQYVSRVRFTETIERLYEDGARIFVEVGPSGNLTAFVKDILGERTHLAVASNVRKQDGMTQLCTLLAQLFVNRVALDLASLYPNETKSQDVAAAGGTKRPVPRLASELPYIRFTPEEAVRVKGFLLGDAPPQRELRAGALTGNVSPGQPDVGLAAAQAVTSPAQSSLPSGSRVSVPKPATRNQSRASFVAPALTSHFELMHQFLQQQQRVTIAALGRARPMAPVVTQDWGALFALPFPSEIHFAQWSPGVGAKPSLDLLSAVSQRLLSQGEAAYWQSNMASSSGQRAAEWLLGRLVAKSAVRSWFARKESGAPKADDISILSADNGQPIVQLRAGDGQGGPAISLSHVNGMAVAIAANHAVGVDLEMVGRIRNLNGFVRSIFSPSEWSLLHEHSSRLEPQSAALGWTIKEAASKVIGCGIGGKERSFCLEQLSADGRQGVVAYNEKRIFSQSQQVGEMFCTVAYQ
jgi:acyl transferase domain-containing protein/phosphopantetheinyl transferase